MFFYIVLTPISTTSGLCRTDNTRKYHQIDVYIYQCVGRHIKTHKAEKLVCAKCNKVYNGERNLKRHVQENRCQLGDNHIQNSHLGRYIVGYTVGNLVLRRRVSGAVKRDFRTYIRRYTSPNESFEYGYPNSKHY